MKKFVFFSAANLLCAASVSASLGGGWLYDSRDVEGENDWICEGECAEIQINCSQDCSPPAERECVPYYDKEEMYCDSACSFWMRGDYVYLWPSNRKLPPLVTKNNLGNEPVIGEAGTEIVYGDETIGNNGASGVRLAAGFWFGDCQNFGLEARYLFADDWESFDLTSDPLGILGIGRPFYSTTPGNLREDAFYVSGGNIFAGSVDVTAGHQIHLGDILGAYTLTSGCDYKIDLLAGFQYGNIDDSLRVRSITTFLEAGPFDIGSVADVTDYFAVKNRLYAGTLGLRGEKCWERISLTAEARLGMGSLNRDTEISGKTVVTDIDGFVGLQDPVGVLVQDSNRGSYKNSTFVLVPQGEIGFTWGCTDSIGLRLGYTYVYIPSVGLAGEQIDRNVNPAQGTTDPQDPKFDLKTKGYHIHGATAGIVFNF